MDNFSDFSPDLISFRQKVDSPPKFKFLLCSQAEKPGNSEIFYPLFLQSHCCIIDLNIVLSIKFDLQSCEKIIKSITMPFRFNNRELAAIASNDKNKFDKEGILSLREVEDKIFGRTDSESL